MAQPRIVFVHALKKALIPVVTTVGLHRAARPFDARPDLVSQRRRLRARRPRAGIIQLAHILPNITAAIIVTVSLDIGGIILAEATLNFPGLGMQPPNPCWGSMVAVGNRYLQTAPWISLAPGSAIFLTVMSINLLGDGIRDAMDPYLRNR